MNMLATAGIVLGGSFFTAIALLSVAYILYLREKRKIISNLTAFITPAAEGQPSPLYQMISAAGDQLAVNLVARAKATFMGIQSGQARLEKAVAGDIAVDAASAASPLIAAALNSFPSLAKRVRKTPELAALAMQLLSSKKPAADRPAGNGSQPHNLTLF